MSREVVFSQRTSRFNIQYLFSRWAMSEDVTKELERMYEFLYVAPVALLEFDSAGKVSMANPRVAQLFNRFAAGGYFDNFYSFLSDVLPELKDEILSCEKDHCQIMENRRFRLDVPNSNNDESVWMDVTVLRQERDKYIASLNNVTEQVTLQNESSYRGQWIDSITKHLQGCVLFTLGQDGHVDSWNRTGECCMGLTSKFALTKSLDQITSLSDTEASSALAIAKEKGRYCASAKISNQHHEMVEVKLALEAINDLAGDVVGFGVIVDRLN